MAQFIELFLRNRLRIRLQNRFIVDVLTHCISPHLFYQHQTGVRCALFSFFSLQFSLQPANFSPNSERTAYIFRAFASACLPPLRSPETLDFSASDGRNQALKVRDLPNVGELIQQATHMDRQSAAIHIIRFFAKQVEHLRIRQTNQKIETGIRVGHA